MGMVEKSSYGSEAVKKAGKQKPKQLKSKILKVAKDKLPRPVMDVKRQLKIQKALFEIADAASAVKEMQSFYRKLHKIVGTLMYAGNFFIALYDEQADLITWPYRVDTDPLPPTGIEEQHGATGYVLRHGKTLADADGSAQAAMERGEFEQVGSVSEGIAVPLKIKKRTIGVIFVQSYIKGVGYKPEDVRVLEFVAQHIATALTRARAIEETRQRNAELAILNSVQQALAAKLDMQGIYNTVGEKLREIFSARHHHIFWKLKTRMETMGML
jgi:transcriptional regulator with GAF, ATPase, and Fis domain